MNKNENEKNCIISPADMNEHSVVYHMVLKSHFDVSEGFLFISINP